MILVFRLDAAFPIQSMKKSIFTGCKTFRSLTNSGL